MSSVEPFNRLKQCRHGQMLYNIHDHYIGRSFDLYGEFSESEIDLFRQAVRPGNVVLEIGANIGAHTIFLAQQVGPSGVVMAYEPQRIVFQTLCANLAINSLTNVFAFQQAVGSAMGSIVVPQFDYRQVGNFGGLELGKHQHGEDVPLITIDSLNLTRCNFIKIDVEGMEKDVLQGAPQTLARFKPFLYVENDRQDKSFDLIRYIDSIGYRMYWDLPPYFNPNNYLANPENVFGEIVSMNMLCVHKDQAANIEGMQPVEIPK